MNAILSLTAFAFLLFLLANYYDSPASAEDVAAVVSLADHSHSKDAQAVVKAFLSKTPNPTNGQLRELKKDLDKVIVRDIAQSVTGDMLTGSQDKPQQANTKMENRPFDEMGWAEKMEFVALKALPYATVLSLIGMIAMALVRLNQRWIKD